MSIHLPDAAPASRSGYVYAALTVVIWAGFVLVTRIAGTGSLAAWDIAALRFGTAALVLFPAWLFWKRVPLFTMRMFALALIGGVAYALLVYAGFRYAPAAHGALLVSGLLPFTMALCVWVVLGQSPSRTLRQGLLLIALGVGFLAFDTFWRHGGDVRGTQVWFGDLLLVGSSLCWALYSSLIRRWNIGPWETTIGSALLATLIYLPVYVFFLPHALDGAGRGEILLQAVYQGLFVVIVAMVLYLQAMQRLGPARLGALMAVVPAFAGIGSSLALDEPLTGWLVAGLLLTSLGAWASVRR
ncbi:MAG: DMT family transporter [Pseudomonadota bacterium]